MTPRFAEDADVHVLQPVATRVGQQRRDLLQHVQDERPVDLKQRGNDLLCVTEVLRPCMRVVHREAVEDEVTRRPRLIAAVRKVEVGEARSSRRKERRKGARKTTRTENTSRGGHTHTHNIERNIAKQNTCIKQTANSKKGTKDKCKPEE